MQKAIELVKIIMFVTAIVGSVSALGAGMYLVMDEVAYQTAGLAGAAP